MRESAPTYEYSAVRAEEDSAVALPTENDVILFKGELLRFNIQPKTAPDGGEVTGGEVLLRNVTGRHTPHKLIEDAERDGEIHEVTLAGIRFAAQVVACSLEHSNAVPLSVNVLASEFTPAFVAEVETILAEYNVPPEYLVLEIVERQALEDGQFESLRELRKSGVKLSIDDFGSGFATMETLQRLLRENVVVDEVKLDRTVANSEHAEKTTHELFALGIRHVVYEAVDGLNQVSQWVAGRGMTPQVATVAVQAHVTGRAMHSDHFFERVRAGREYVEG